MHDIFPEQVIDIQNNVEALPGETVTLATELPETGLDVFWLKDNVPLSIAEGKHEIINQNTSYQLLISDATVEDGGVYTVKGGEHKSTVSLAISGWWSWYSFFTIIYISIALLVLIFFLSVKHRAIY